MQEEREIERKYRIVSWTPEARRMLLRDADSYEHYRQGYHSIDPAERIRLIYGSGEPYVVKTRKEQAAGPQRSGVKDRMEYNDDVSFEEGCALYESAPRKLEKVRFRCGRYEIDVFVDRYHGLEILEIELEDPDEEVSLPEGLELEEIGWSNAELSRAVNMAEFDGISYPAPRVVEGLGPGLKEITTHIEELLAQSPDRPITVCFGGPSASGKTTFAKLINAYFGDISALFSLDNYFIGRTAMEERGVQNFDTPHALDLPLAYQQIESLQAGRAVGEQMYSFEKGEPEGMQRFEPPARLLIVEGTFALHPMLRHLFDLTVFVDVSAHGALWRRIKRDIKRTGQAPAEIFEQWAREVYPAYKVFIAPQRAAADIVVQNDMDPFTEMVLEESQETQIKACVPDTLSVESLFEALASSGLDFEETGELFQNDAYYRAKDWPDISHNELIRVRREKPAGINAPRLLLSYKAPQDPTFFYRRGKIEFEIKPRHSELLHDVGYEFVGNIIKTRRVFQSFGNDVRIMVDELRVPKKEFWIEVQGRDSQMVEAVVRALRLLGIKKKQFTGLSYLELLLIKP